jgi:hypothetical protein
VPIILATWEAEIRRIMVRGQPRQIVLDTSLLNITRVTKRQWLMPVFLATQEAEIMRIIVQSQIRHLVLRPYLEKMPHKESLAD